ncbi:MAG: Adenine DNA glycosylase [Chlamydiales bacterium]|nr:Adenine DNA glycosylase [Chlamydiales bacterium]MCH9635182.1 Adenine DNA glycosylase [Chlamydiales bacterium]
MLQQTQASVVIPYFERWMEAFPTIEALAKAPVEHVLKLWEGLGYYSRARNLHKGAKEIVSLGGFPEDLQSISGIGPYTAGAIKSFAFHQKAAAVDGNVLRVMARYLGEEGEIDKPAVRKKLTQAVEDLLPNEEPWVVMEALIELGALVCQKKPKCSNCPLRSQCQSFRHGLNLPNRSPRVKITKLERTVAVIECDGYLLLKKGDPGRVMADLFEFPYLEGRRDPADFGRDLDYVGPLLVQKHSFTRYRVTLYPHHFVASSRKGEGWKKREEVGTLPFSSGHKRVYEDFTHREFARMGRSRDPHSA